MQIAICDDELQELECIADIVMRYQSNLNITKFDSADSLYRAFISTSFDIILLDIEMPEPNGYEIAKKLMKNIEQTTAGYFCDQKHSLCSSRI